MKVDSRKNSKIIDLALVCGYSKAARLRFDRELTAERSGVHLFYCSEHYSE